MSQKAAESWPENVFHGRTVCESSSWSTWVQPAATDCWDMVLRPQPAASAPVSAGGFRSTCSQTQQNTCHHSTRSIYRCPTQQWTPRIPGVTTCQRDSPGQPII